MDGLMFPDVGELVERLVDEDDGDQTRKAFLGETCDVANEETELERHDDQQSHHHPEPDPETKRHERQAVVSTQLNSTQSINQSINHFIVIRHNRTHTYTREIE